MANNGNAIALYTGGINELREVAVRADGASFCRWQERGPYGYRWGAWRPSFSTVDVTALPPSVDNGFATLYLQTPGSYRWHACRLPKT